MGIDGADAAVQAAALLDGHEARGQPRQPWPLGDQHGRAAEPLGDGSPCDRNDEIAVELARIEGGAGIGGQLGVQAGSPGPARRS